MNTMSLKEKAVMAMLAVVVMYAIAGATYFMHSKQSWKLAKKNYEKAKAEYASHMKLIGEKRKWIDDYEAAKAMIPSFKSGTDTDTTWYKIMGEIAERSVLRIQNRDKGGDIIENGEVKEQPIVSGWEGSLEALVRFMYEIETSEDGMFDFAKLDFKPNSKKPGYLSGSFTLNCAYMIKE